MTQLEKSVLGAGFVAMTEDELYEVNGGKTEKSSTPKLHIRGNIEFNLGVVRGKIEFDNDRKFDSLREFKDFDKSRISGHSSDFDRDSDRTSELKRGGRRYAA